mmetsp:Transcript_55474/g.154632  ORF Transcript_55474/g.154632 Transcript_55474/m.154632 type:complete len:272 (+) Transcript_55474:1078-1893(+)
MWRRVVASNSFMLSRGWTDELVGVFGNKGSTSVKHSAKAGQGNVSTAVGMVCCTGGRILTFSGVFESFAASPSFLAMGVSSMSTPDASKTFTLPLPLVIRGNMTGRRISDGLFTDGLRIGLVSSSSDWRSLSKFSPHRLSTRSTCQVKCSRRAFMSDKRHLISTSNQRLIPLESSFQSKCSVRCESDFGYIPGCSGIGTCDGIVAATQDLKDFTLANDEGTKHKARYGFDFLPWRFAWSSSSSSSSIREAAAAAAAISVTSPKRASPNQYA